MSETASSEWLNLFDVDRDDPAWLPTAPKRGSLAIATAFESLGGWYSEKAARMRECGEYLEFACYRIGDSEEVERRLVRCSWCRVRLCFLCERARSRKRCIQLIQLTDAWMRKRPKHQALLGTFTKQSVPDDELSVALDNYMESWRRMTRSTRFKRAVVAWYRTIETTRNAETTLWHVHMHVLLFVGPAYFRKSSRLYIDQKKGEWTALWRKAARLDYDPVVDVRALDGVGGGPLGDIGRKSLAEVTKYVTEPSDLVEFDENGEPLPVDPQVLKTLCDALHGRRLTGMSGALREVSRELGHTDVDADNADLSGPDVVPDDAVYLGREFYRWQAGLRDYVRIPHAEWQPPTREGDHVGSMIRNE